MNSSVFACLFVFNQNHTAKHIHSFVKFMVRDMHFAIILIIIVLKVKKTLNLYTAIQVFRQQ